MNTAPGPGRFLTLANLLSLSRIPLAGLFWVALHGQQGFPWMPLAVLGVAGITDILDGRVARLAHQKHSTSPFTGQGAWLDPVCDKIFVGLVLVALFVERAHSLGVLCLVYTRELVQIPSALGYRFIPYFRNRVRYVFTAAILGKCTTVLQFAAIVSLIVNTPATLPLAVAAAVVGLLAAGEYLWRAHRLAHHPTRSESGL